MTSESTLVTGATGKTGSRIAARLEALGCEVRRGSRRAPIPFDWEQPETWGPALAGQSAVYICDDLADVAVVALLEDGHEGQTYELTGPRLMKFAEVADVLTEATGRAVCYVPTSGRCLVRSHLTTDPTTQK